MKKIVYALCLIILVGAWCSNGFCATARQLYKLADQRAASGQPDFAFMHWRNLLRDFPQSQQAQPALFALGEYYYSLPDYKQAVTSFESYLKKYPDSGDRLFALAYLLRIARLRGQDEQVDALEKEIIGLKQLGLVFSDYKEYSTQTPLHKDFQAVFHIDTITFYLNGEVFEKILY